MTLELKPNFRNSRNTNNLSNTINNPKEQNQQVAFKGFHPIKLANKGYTESMRACDQNVLVDVFGRDVFAMILPRTWIDMSRNVFAGSETLFRECFSAFVDLFLPGLTARGAAYVAGKSSANKHKVNTDTWANSEQLKLINSAINKNGKDGHAWIEQILEHTKGLNGDGNTGWKALDKLGQKDRESIAKELYNAVKSQNKQDIKTHTEAAMKQFIESSGVQKNLKIDASKVGASGEIRTNLKDLFNNIVSSGKSLANVSEIARNDAAKFLQKLSKVKSLIALGTAASVGVSLQFVNRWLTKRRTGCDGFVGYADYDKNIAKNSNKKEKKKFKPKLFVAKLASVAGFAMLPLTLISGHKNPLKVLNKKGLTEFAKKLEFTNPYPSMNQIRAVFSTIIMGRIIASSDENELRETMIRDTASYFSWLCLGGLASKAWAAASAGKIANNPLFNFTKKCPEKNFFKQLGHLISDKTALKSHGELGKEHIGKLNNALMFGIANSCLMLGVGIPYLNKIQTNLKTKKWKLGLDKKNKPKEQINQFEKTKSLINTLNTNKNNELYSSFLGDIKSKPMAIKKQRENPS